MGGFQFGTIFNPSAHALRIIKLQARRDMWSLNGVLHKLALCAPLVFFCVLCGSIDAAEGPTRRSFYTYLNDQPGCRADSATDLELVVDRGAARWIIVAPARVISTGKERRHGGLPGWPLDIEVARPLELALLQKIAESKGEDIKVDRFANVTRIKIVSVWHGILGLGMGEAVPQIALRFHVCRDSDSSEIALPKQVARNGPNINTFWHQPRSQELRDGFRNAADKAINAIVEIATHPLE